jgi:hypothetical protein
MAFRPGRGAVELGRFMLTPVLILRYPKSMWEEISTVV